MAIDNKLRQIIQIKSDIKDAIVDKGVEMPAGLPFGEYANKIGEISGGGEKDPPNREDINLYTSGSIDTSIDSAGISVNSYGEYICALANTYDDSSITIPLEKTLDHYEVNIRLQTIALQHQPNFGAISWRGFAEIGIGNYVNLLSRSRTSYLPKYGWRDFVGEALYCSPIDIVDIKYVFSDDTITNTISTSDTNTITTTISKSLRSDLPNPTSMNTVNNMFLFGDSGDSYQSANRTGAGKIFFKGTYIRDLDTGNIVWELCDGYNK